MRPRLLAVVLAACLAVTGCGAQQAGARLGDPVEATASPSEPDESPPTAEPPSDPTESELPAEPVVGECRDYDAEDTEPAVNDAPVVDCADEHTATTFHVGTLTADDDDTLLREGIAQCQPEFGAALGATGPVEYGGLLLTYAFYRPSDEAWEQGERWLRCDLVAQTTMSLLPLPEDVTTVLSDAQVATDYAKCLLSSGNPVPCSRAHAYEWVGGFTVTDLAEPDDAVLLEKADGPCTRQAGSGNWYATWPGDLAWAAGETVVWCWRPVA